MSSQCRTPAPLALWYPPGRHPWTGVPALRRSWQKGEHHHCLLGAVRLPLWLSHILHLLARTKSTGRARLSYWQTEHVVDHAHTGRARQNGHVLGHAQSAVHSRPAAQHQEKLRLEFPGPAAESGHACNSAFLFAPSSRVQGCSAARAVPRTHHRLRGTGETHRPHQARRRFQTSAHSLSSPAHPLSSPAHSLCSPDPFCAHSLCRPHPFWASRCAPFRPRFRRCT